IRAALSRSPDSVELWTVLGGAYGRSGDFAHAIDAYEHSVALKPTALACKTLAALVFEVRHDRARAVQLWEQSLELDRNQPDVQQFVQQFGLKSPTTWNSIVAAVRRRLECRSIVGPCVVCVETIV